MRRKIRVLWVQLSPEVLGELPDSTSYVGYERVLRTHMNDSIIPAQRANPLAPPLKFVADVSDPKPVIDQNARHLADQNSS